MAATSFRTRSHGTVTCTPFAGRMDAGCSPSSRARTSSAQTPVALTTARARDRELVGSGPDPRAHDAAPVALESDDLGVVQRGRPVHDGRACDREGEPGVVGVRVVVDVRTGETIAIERGELGERLVDAHATVALADPQTTREVVHPQRAAEHRRQPAVEPAPAREDGHQKRENPDQMRCVLEDQLSLRESFVDQAELVLVEVAEPAVYQLRTA